MTNRDKDLIRAEIAKLRAEKERYGWAPHSSAWQRCFGQIAGLYRAIELIDGQVDDAKEADLVIAPR